MQMIANLSSFIPHIKDPMRRALVQSVVDAFATDIAPDVPLLRKGVSAHGAISSAHGAISASGAPPFRGIHSRGRHPTFKSG
jgi:hypothetical protein